MSRFPIRPLGRALRRRHPATPLLEPLEVRQFLSVAAPAIAGTTADSSTVPALATSVSTFPVYDALDIPGKPSLSSAGITPMNIVYYTQWEDEATIRALARDAAAKGQILCLDQESWDVDIRTSSKTVVDANIARFQKIINWIRSEAPTVKFGFYDTMPPGFNMVVKDDPTALAAWDAATAYLTPLASQVDYIFPRVYPSHGDLTGWQDYASRLVAHGRTYGKPVLPFITFKYQGGTQAEEYVDNASFRGMLDTIRRIGDGVVLWGSDTAWNPDAGWYTQVQQFINDPPIAPVAPTNFLAVPTPDAVKIAWTDASDNETAFVLEKSVNGGATFSTLAVLPKDTTTYTDPTALGGLTYAYRTRATNGWGDSPTTAASTVRTIRSGTRPLNANSWTAQSGTYNDGPGIAGVDGGDWAHYSTLDFGSGADTFNASIAVPAQYAGQKIEIRLDSLSSTPIATLTTTSTGSWTTFSNQTASFPLVTGVHEVFLVARGSVGVANLAQFSFSYTGAVQQFTGVTNTGSAYDVGSGVYRDGQAFAGLDGGDYARFNRVNFGSGIDTFSATLAVPANLAGQKIEVRLDSLSNAPIATLTTTSTGSWTNYVAQSTAATFTTGIHDVFIVGKGATGIANVTQVAFTPTRPAPVSFSGASYDAGSGIYRDGQAFASLDGGDYALYRGVNFSSGIDTLTATLAVPASNAGQKFEIRLDSLSSAPVATLTTTATGSWTSYADQSVAMSLTSGTHDVYVVGKGGSGIANIQKLAFSATGAPAVYTGVTVNGGAFDAGAGIYRDNQAFGGLDGGDYALFKGLDFSTGVDTLSADIAVPAAFAGQKIDIRLDSPTGALIGTLTTTSTGSWTTFTTQTTAITRSTGVHDVYLVGKGSSGIGNVGRLAFTPTGATPVFNGVSYIGAAYDAGSGIYRDAQSFAGFDGGDYATYKAVDFSTGAKTVSIVLAVPASNAGQKIEVHLDSLSSTPIATFTTTSTGSWTNYVLQSLAIPLTTGTHDVYLVGKGTIGIANVQKISFT